MVSRDSFQDQKLSHPRTFRLLASPRHLPCVSHERYLQLRQQDTLRVSSSFRSRQAKWQTASILSSCLGSNQSPAPPLLPSRKVLGHSHRAQQRTKEKFQGAKRMVSFFQQELRDHSLKHRASDRLKQHSSSQQIPILQDQKIHRHGPLEVVPSRLRNSIFP